MKPAATNTATLQRLATTRLLTMTPEQISALERRLDAAITGARWREAKRLVALRRRVAHLLPSATKDLVELDDLARTLDECEAAGITPEDAAEVFPPGSDS